MAFKMHKSLKLRIFFNSVPKDLKSQKCELVDGFKVVNAFIKSLLKMIWERGSKMATGTQTQTA
jgi:hypothetical protein